MLFYTKADCPLCDKGWPVAAALAQRFGLELRRVDILADPVLRRRYGEKIPVLTLGDIELGWGLLSKRAIETKLDRHLNASSPTP